MSVQYFTQKRDFGLVKKRHKATFEKDYFFNFTKTFDSFQGKNFKSRTTI